MSKTVMFVGAHNRREIDFYILIAKRLAKEGIRSKFISQYQRYAIELSRTEGVDIVAIPHWIQSNWRDIPDLTAAVDTAELKYGLTSLRQVFNGDRELFESEEAECVDRSLRYFEAWEALFNAEPINAVVSAIGGELIRTTSFFAAKRHGIRTLYLNFFPLPHRFVLVSTLHGDFLDLDLTCVPDLSPEQDSEAQMLLDQLRGQASRFFIWQPPALKAEYVSKTVSRLYFSLFADRYAYPSRWVVRKAWYLVQRSSNYLLSRLLYEYPHLDRKFVFFPLHDSEDFQLRVRAPHCQNQEFIVRLVADSLPIGYELYVKEHPNFLGGISTTALRQIKQIPRVRLLSPAVSALDLISAARAVVTINSTVGFEAIVRSKPVISLGPSFYRGKGLTSDVGNFYDLPVTIKQTIGTKPDERLVKKFLYYAVRKTWLGDYTLRDFSDENIGHVAHAILEELDRV